MARKSFIIGCAGLSLTENERAYYAEHRPIGFILFSRNCSDKSQVAALVDQFKTSVGSEEVLVLIDQEGGRVARLTPPHWLAFPAARKLGQLTEADPDRGVEATKLLSQLMASELVETGINVDCLPVLDMPVAGADEIIGSRAYGEKAETVIAAGRAAAEGLMAGGVLPVIKHIPGHGRATCDSHLSLPVIETHCEALEAADFVPFKALNDMPLGMTAHVKLTAFDNADVASASRTIVDDVIRGIIGFDGVLMCDDLSMNALDGTMEERTRRVIDAGCDLALHCNGDFSEMVDVAEACDVLSGSALRRVADAFSKLHSPQDFDRERAEYLRLELLAA